MGYSMNDLNNGVNGIKNALDERSQRRGQELADQVIHGNLIGFIFARWFNFLTLGVAITLLMNKVFNISEGISFLSAFILAIFILRTDRFWYMRFWKAIGLFSGLFILVSFLDSI